jgi:hypothetical protein
MPNLANLSAEERNHQAWDDLDPTELNDEQKALYYCRRDNLIAYLDETSVSSETRKLPRQEIHRLLSRCLERNSHGNMWGWQALAPGTHIKPYCRSKEVTPCGIGQCGGRAGALTALFKRFPDLWTEAKADFLGKLKKDKCLNVKDAVTEIHQKMLSHCKVKLIAQRVEQGESNESAEINYVLDYPFNTTNCGLRSLLNHLNG